MAACPQRVITAWPLWAQRPLPSPPPHPISGWVCVHSVLSQLGLDGRRPRLVHGLDGGGVLLLGLVALQLERGRQQALGV